MPDNPIAGKAGNTTRLRSMLSYFNDNNSIDVTFVSLKDWGIWKDEEINSFANQFPNIKLQLLEKKFKKNFFKYIFLYKIPYFFKNNSIDISSYILRKNFAKIANAEKLDVIIVSYASWGQIIDDVKGNPYSIIDTHDFITAQKSRRKNEVGRYFQDEIQILKKFDEIWTYSVEEEYIFEQFTDKKVTLIPVSFPLNFNEEHSSFKYDVIYVASNNPHNIAGINWFLKEVLPLLKDIKIHIIGKICTQIGDYENVVKHGMVDDLNDYYKNAKVAICPMLSGTGIKIKVIEALSYGIPVVTNRRGVDGLVNKKENGCLVTDDPKIFAEEIKHLLEDEIFYNRIKNEGISYFKNNHDPKLEVEIMNTIFK
ncbi:glycosyltransferase family 4 protein [Kaistella sp. G5-32]|uniref:Glycosyltransferase family 4 protein n=2 Tax=Kaistella gelatinilytica TaxID=2787636 RepID=A0ABS0FEX5_9FLAO|nr:glycosyltransferase family 4 protein [Kaistella gelatinilytica]